MSIWGIPPFPHLPFFTPAMRRFGVLDVFILSTQKVCGSETEAAKTGMTLAPESDLIDLV